MLRTLYYLVYLALWSLCIGISSVYAQTAISAPVGINRLGWIVSADSSQSGNNASFIVDGDKTTFWQSSNTSLPHNLTLDMQSCYMVNGITYLPRQEQSSGNIGRHTIQLSLDGLSWTVIAQGTWPNDQSLKTTLFNPQLARYIRLEAQSNASGGQLSSAAEITVLTNPHSTLSRQQWQVSADSQQGTANSYNASEAIDGSSTTYWHTQYSPSTSPFPHYFTIDQGAAYTVGGLTYLPRPPSTGSNGNIGRYQVQQSSDGLSWSTICNGSWPDSKFLKTVHFQRVTTRYLRLVALSEAGNRGTFTSAAEINLLDGGAVLSDFKVTVDSQETAAANNSGITAMDGDLGTFWHSSWSGVANAPLPHFFSVDMQTAYPVRALTYTPRQDGSKNGNIGNHSIDISSDGATWTNVAKGAFYDDPTTKRVDFQEMSARYVRLTAYSEAGNRGPWSSAAEIVIDFDTTYIATKADTMGKWGHMINFPIVPVAAALINGTKILAWSSEFADSFSGGSKSTLTATYDLTTGWVSERMVTNTDHDMFCPGLSMDFKGQPFVTGGNNAPRTSIYDFSTDSWISGPDMNIARGYQASQTLSDGRIFTIGGSWSGGEGGKNGEVYSMARNSWSLLPGALVAPMLTNDAQGVYRADNHGWFFAWSNATVLQAGPSRKMNWYTTINGGGIASAGTRGAEDAMNGNAVMYDAMAGKILTVGGATSYQLVGATANANVLTVGRANETVSVTPVSAMNYRRAFANAVVLPDGSVLVVGGQEYPNPFYDDEAIMYPEIWSPTTQRFTVLAPMIIPRNYHSVALLLPDATVFSGGGGLCGGCSQNHFNGQIFSPPYLFTSNGEAASRPAISALSAPIVKVGNSFTVSTDSAVSSFALVRMGSATHSVDTDQRRIPLKATSAGTNSYRLTIPMDPGVALPGNWMLFAINSAGVPSVAKTVLIAPVAPIA